MSESTFHGMYGQHEWADESVGLLIESPSSGHGFEFVVRRPVKCQYCLQCGILRVHPEAMPSDTIAKADDVQTEGEVGAAGC